MSNKIADLQKTIKKNKNGYNYKYADLAAIHEMLAGAKISYWQETITENGKDYICTHVVDDETGEELRKGRGSEIVPVQEINGKVNPPQAMGGSISYSRRYSLLLILGLATEDDDAESLTRQAPKPVERADDKPRPTGNRVSFDEIREKIKNMRGTELEFYKDKIMAQKMTYKQKDAINAIFEKRRAEIMAQNMGFKPKEG